MNLKLPYTTWYFLTGLLLCLGMRPLKAQESINNAGGEATGSGGTLSYSVGQVVFHMQTGLTGQEAQGVQHICCTLPCLDSLVVDTDTIVDNVYRVSGSLVTDGIIEPQAVVLMLAGESIVFQPGFSVPLGAELIARIEDCGVGNLYKEIPDVMERNSQSDPGEGPESITPAHTAFAVYPNPVKRQLTVQCTTQRCGGAQYRLYSLQGQLVKSGPLLAGSTKIDVAELSPTIYLLYLFPTGNDDFQLEKIIKIK